MGADSKIEWTGSTWNPTRGCSRTGPECDRCYAMTFAHRFSGPTKPYDGLTTIRNGHVDWTGIVRLIPEMLDVPLRCRKPTTWFVDSMSDLFHASLSDEQIADVFGVMAVAAKPFGGKYVPGSGWVNQSGPHTFQLLTKRGDRMRKTLNSARFRALVSQAAYRWARDRVDAGWLAQCISGVRDWGNNCTLDKMWPLPNAWLGVSCGNRKDGLPRLDELRQVPAAVRFVSFEPLLEDLGKVDLTGIHWAIVGAESGPGARTMQDDWARSLRDQCVAAGVKFFLKQKLDERGRKVSLPILDGRQWAEMPEVRS